MSNPTLSRGKKISFDVAITNNLEIGFFARGDVTAEEGKIALERLIELLQTEEIQLSGITEVEKHVDDQRLQAVHDLTHERNHRH